MELEFAAYEKADDKYSFALQEKSPLRDRLAASNFGNHRRSARGRDARNDFGRSFTICSAK